jgi:hypothetical protein
MSDYPRFQVTQPAPDQAFKHYSGARQVELVLRLADAWLRHRAQIRCFLRDTAKVLLKRAQRWCERLARRAPSKGMR